VKTEFALIIAFPMEEVIHTDRNNRAIFNFEPISYRYENKETAGG